MRSIRQQPIVAAIDVRTASRADARRSRRAKL